MAKKDLLAGLTNEIPLKKDPFCDGLQDAFGSGMDSLEDKLKNVKNYGNDIKDALTKIPTVDLDNKLDAFGKLKDMIDDKLKVGTGDADELLKCLGTSVLDIFGIDTNKLLNDPDIDFSKYPNSISDSLTNHIDNLLGSILNKAEKSILDLLREMESQVDIGALDDLLALAGCFAEHCNPPDTIPAVLDIEKKMEEAGLKIGGDVDLGQSLIEKVDQDHYSKLNDARRELDDSIAKKIKKIF